MTLRESITRIIPELPPREQSVALFVAANPLDVLSLATSDLATMTGVSEATVVRAARSMGYSGLKELKQACSDAVAESRDLVSVISQRISGIDNRGALRAVLRDSAELISSFEQTVDERAWIQLTELTASAKRIVFYGLGTAGAVAEYAEIELRRIGRDAMAITEAGHVLADALMKLSHDDTVVVLAPLRLMEEIKTVLSTAKAMKIPTTIITQVAEDPISRLADNIIPIPQTVNSVASETAIVWTLADAMVSELAERDSSRALSARMRLQDS